MKNYNRPPTTTTTIVTFVIMGSVKSMTNIQRTILKNNIFFIETPTQVVNFYEIKHLNAYLNCCGEIKISRFPWKILSCVLILCFITKQIKFYSNKIYECITVRNRVSKISAKQVLYVEKQKTTIYKEKNHPFYSKNKN